MFVIGNLIEALTGLLDWLLWVLKIAIFLRVILSWADANPYNGFVRLVGWVTEPFLAPFRRLLPPWRMKGWDLSPIFAILAIQFLQIFLIRSLYEWAARMH